MEDTEYSRGRERGAEAGRGGQVLFGKRSVNKSRCCLVSDILKHCRTKEIIKKEERRKIRQVSLGRVLFLLP